MASSSFLSKGKFAFIADLVLRYSAVKGVFIDRKDNRECWKSRLLFKKMTFTGE